MFILPICFAVDLIVPLQFPATSPLPHPLPTIVDVPLAPGKLVCVSHFACRILNLMHPVYSGMLQRVLQAMTMT
jgi:hypothetical protein